MVTHQSLLATQCCVVLPCALSTIVASFFQPADEHSPVERGYVGDEQFCIKLTRHKEICAAIRGCVLGDYIHIAQKLVRNRTQHAEAICVCAETANVSGFKLFLSHPLQKHPMQMTYEMSGQARLLQSVGKGGNEQILQLWRQSKNRYVDEELNVLFGAALSGKWQQIKCRAKEHIPLDLEQKINLLNAICESGNVKCFKLALSHFCVNVEFTGKVWIHFLKVCATHKRRELFEYIIRRNRIHLHNVARMIYCFGDPRMFEEYPNSNPNDVDYWDDSFCLQLIATDSTELWMFLWNQNLTYSRRMKLVRASFSYSRKSLEWFTHAEQQPYPPLPMILYTVAFFEHGCTSEIDAYLEKKLVLYNQEILPQKKFGMARLCVCRCLKYSRLDHAKKWMQAISQSFIWLPNDLALLVDTLLHCYKNEETVTLQFVFSIENPLRLKAEDHIRILNVVCNQSKTSVEDYRTLLQDIISHSIYCLGRDRLCPVFTIWHDRTFCETCTNLHQDLHYC